MTKKNILLLVNQLHGGGAQKVIANLSIQLQGDYNVALAIYNDIDKIVFPFAGELIKISLPFSADTHNNNFFKRTYRSLVLFRKLKRIKKEKKIAVCISFMEASNIANILSRYNEKTVLSVRSYLSKEFLDHRRLLIFKNVIRFLYRRANAIIAPSELIKTDLVNNFGVPENKISIIYNFIDQKIIEEKQQGYVDPEIAKVLNSHPVIINVGRITYPKAQWLLPKVLKRVQETVPGARLVILGEGPMDVKIKEEADQSGLAVYTPQSPIGEKGFDIYMPGFTVNPYPYLKKAAVFIKSSVYEGFPNVIIEAMASGLPIISSDCTSGPREILSPDTPVSTTAHKLEEAPYGLLTPVYSEETNNLEQYLTAASGAVIEILTNSEKKNYYIKQSLERAAQYEKEIIMRQWIRVIENKP